MNAQEYLDLYREYRRKERILDYEASCLLHDANQMEAYIDKPLRRYKHRLMPEIEEHKAYAMQCRRRSLHFHKLLQEMQNTIDSVGGVEGELLRLRYVDGLRWEEICERTFCSLSTVHREHRKSLQMLQHILDTNCHQP